MFEIRGKYSDAIVYAETIEPEAISQIQAMTNNIAFTNDIAIMPDAHKGAGSCIGFTMKMVNNKIVPNIIGVDIGCSVISFGLGSGLMDKFVSDETPKRIRKLIPFGCIIHPKPIVDFEKTFRWKIVNGMIEKIAFILGQRDIPHISYKWLIERCKKIGMPIDRFLNSIGSIGGGNHFVELNQSYKTEEFYVTIHTGSRNFGKVVCKHHMNIAKKRLGMKRKKLVGTKIKEILETTEDKTKIPEKIKAAKDEAGTNDTWNELAYLEDRDMFDYVVDMVVAQEYARLNRYVVGAEIAKFFERPVSDVIESTHNYIDFDDMIIRKGAIRSYQGEKMIIPYTMKDGSIICEGKSNPEWNYSAPHGAGRIMSRRKAKDTLDVETFQNSMKGIHSDSVCKATLDEDPRAYKNPEEIERLVEPTVTIIDRLLVIRNLKDKMTKEEIIKYFKG